MAEKKKDPPKEKNGTQQPAEPRNDLKSKPPLDADNLVSNVAIHQGEAEPLETVDPTAFKRDGQLWPAQAPKDDVAAAASQPTAATSDGTPLSQDSPLAFVDMDDDKLVGCALEECKKRGIRSKAAFLQEVPDIAVEVIDRGLLNSVFTEKAGKAEWGSGPTKIDIHAQLPANELAALDAAQKREAQKVAQQEPSATEGTSGGDGSIAPGPSAASTQDESAQGPPSVPLASNGGGPTETDEMWLRQFTELTQDMIGQVGDQNIPLDEALKKAEDFYAIAIEELKKRKKLDPASIGGLYHYVLLKKNRGDNVTPLEEAIFELGNLRARIDKYSQLRQKESEEVSPPVPEVPAAPRQEPVKEAESKVKPPFMIRPKPPMVEPSAKKKRGSFLTHRMTVAVVATAALSWAIHVRNAFSDAAITLNRLWEEALHFKPIDITAKQVMYTFYGLIGLTTVTWLYRKIKKFRRHRRFFRRLREGYSNEYDYMIRELRNIRNKSADYQEQSMNLQQAMIEDENLFFCLNLFNKTPDEATGESGAINALSKAGLAPGVISNFYMLIGSAEKRIILKRFKELAKSWVPPKVRRNKLRKLCQESPVFAEKLAELFRRDESGNYTSLAMGKRSKYAKLKNIEKLSGDEILSVLEQDYNEIKDDLSSEYSI